MHGTASGVHKVRHDVTTRLVVWYRARERRSALIEQHVTIKRLITSISASRLVLRMILALYVGISDLNHL
jgi:hypothetical protein